MKTIKYYLLLLALCAVAVRAGAQGTAFTYQGRLNDGANPANGIYDLRFAIYDLPTAGTLLGGPVTNSPTAVSNGLFTVTLDFGSGIFTGAARWVEIGVSANGGGAFTTLQPRQPITPTPYAIRAANFSGTIQASQLSGTISPDNIGSGTITSAMLATGAIHSNHLALGSVTAEALATGAIHSNHLALGSVTTEALATGAIRTHHLDVGSVTTQRLPTRPIPSNQLAFGSITTARLATGAIHSNHLALGSVTTEALAAGAIHSNHLAFGSVTTEALAAGAIQSNNLAFGSVTTEALTAGAIHSNDLAFGSVTTEALAAGGVTAEKLATVTNWFALTITNPSPISGDLFGRSVAAVGSDRFVIGGDNTREAYLFSINGGLLTTFTNPVAGGSGSFGTPVAAMGSDRVLVGAQFDDTGAANAGAVYLFSTNGTLLTTFTNPTPLAGERFGFSVVAVGSDRVLIGAPSDNAAGFNAGAAYLFRTNGALLTVFTSPPPASGDFFGGSVAAVGSDR